MEGARRATGISPGDTAAPTTMTFGLPLMG
jgi:hypothetical protein